MDKMSVKVLDEYRAYFTLTSIVGSLIPMVLDIVTPPNKLDYRLLGGIIGVVGYCYVKIKDIFSLFLGDFRRSR